MGPIVFFKHKYLTAPTLTPADALTIAADNLAETMKGMLPKKGLTQEAIEKLMEIFKQSAEKEKRVPIHKGC